MGKFRAIHSDDAASTAIHRSTCSGWARRLMWVASFVATGAPAVASADTEPLLRPGSYYEETVNTMICGKKAAIKLYGVPYSAHIADYLAWYRSRLTGYHYVHQVWAGRAQETFYSPDGTSGLTLTGTQDGDGVSDISFASIAGGLTPHQMDTFSPANPQCK